MSAAIAAQIAAAALHRDCARSASGKRPVPAHVVFSVGFGISIVADLSHRPAAQMENKQQASVEHQRTLSQKQPSLRYGLREPHVLREQRFPDAVELLDTVEVCTT